MCLISQLLSFKKRKTMNRQQFNKSQQFFIFFQPKITQITKKERRKDWMLIPVWVSDSCFNVNSIIFQLYYGEQANSNSYATDAVISWFETGTKECPAKTLPV